jgi:ubiquinone/menaquinone biosynthesis C-methylase UbiE
MSELYDRIGHGYATQRRPDPRIYRQIRQRLGDVSSLVNVGAGTGSYEPTDLPVIAVEPSAEMIAQRTVQTNVVQAKAEELPFRDASFDATLAILTVHHWQDRQLGLQECARAARRQVSMLTWDPESDGFWLTREYFPELLAYDRRIFPRLDEIRTAWGRVAVESVSVPANCVDGFLGAY